MGRNRLEAFSDGDISIIVTIMVIEMKVSHGEKPGRTVTCAASHWENHRQYSLGQLASAVLIIAFGSSPFQVGSQSETQLAQDQRSHVDEVFVGAVTPRALALADWMRLLKPSRMPLLIWLSNQRSTPSQWFKTVSDTGGRECQNTCVSCEVRVMRSFQRDFLAPFAERSPCR